MNVLPPVVDFVTGSGAAAVILFAALAAAFFPFFFHKKELFRSTQAGYKDRVQASRNSLPLTVLFALFALLFFAGTIPAPAEDDCNLSSSGDFASKVANCDVVKLTSKIEGRSFIIPTDTTVELDLGEYTINCEKFECFVVQGTLTLTGSGSIIGGYASNGGGVYVKSGGTLNMNGGSITGSSAGKKGGGVYVENGGAFSMYGGSITGNSAKDIGGVYVESGGAVSMNGGSSTGNSAGDKGGGVYVESGGTFNMGGGSITGNSAVVDIGGVYVESGGTFNLGGGTIKGNTTGTDSKISNVYLDGGVINITGILTGTEQVGVQQRYGNFTSGLGNYGSAGYFFSDDPAYFVKGTDSGEAYFVAVMGRMDCGKEGNNVTCTLVQEDNTLIISGTGEMKDFDSELLINGLMPHRLEIRDGITHIGTHAFQKYSYLTSVNIPASVTSIGDYAFSSSGLTSVTIPENVTSIGTGAFAGCGSLSSFSVEQGNQTYTAIDGILFSKDGSTLIQYPAGKEGTSYVISDTVTSVGADVFKGCGDNFTVYAPGDLISNAGSVGLNDNQVKPYYAVTAPTDGSITLIGSETLKEASYYYEGETVRMTVDPGDHFVRVSAYETGNSTKTVSLTSQDQYTIFEMPGHDVTVSSEAVSLTPEDLTYDGTDRTDDFILKAGDKTLTDADYSASFRQDSGDPAAPKTAGRYTAQITGKGSYAGAAAVSFEIKRNTAALVISSESKDWPYDGQTHTYEVYTVTYAGAGVPTSESGNVFTLGTGDTVTITPTAAGVKDYDASYSGNNTFTYVLTNAESYSAVTVNTGTLSITKASITPEVTMSGYTYTWGETIPDPKLADGGNPGNGDVTFYYSTENSSSGGTKWEDNAGKPLDTNIYYMYAVVSETDNYLGAASAAKKFVVNKADEAIVTISGHQNTVVYDGAEHRVSGYDVEISNPLYTTDDFSFSGTAEAKRTDAGTSVMGLNAGKFMNLNVNFSKVTFRVTDGFQTVTPKEVTVTADNRNKTEGEEDPQLTATVEGTLSGDTVDYTLSRAEGEEPGTYVITVSGEASQENYAVTFVNGTFTIIEKGAASHTLTINYVYADNTEAADPFVQTYQKGAAYSVKSPAIEGLTPDTDTVSGTMGDADVTVTVTYNENTMKIKVQFVFVQHDGSYGVPFDIKEGTLKPVLTLKKGDKAAAKSGALKVKITAGAKDPSEDTAAFSEKVEDLAPGKYEVSVSGLPKEMEREVPDSADAPKIKLTAKAEINEKDGEIVITVYLIFDGRIQPKYEEPVVYPLPEDEIGAYWLKKDGTKEYLLFQTYDICMDWLGSDELCRGYERCYHKDGK